MKKLIIALAAVALGVSAHAANVRWTTSTALFMGNDSDTFAGTVYLVDTASGSGGIAQAALLSAFLGGTLTIGNYDVASASASAGKITATTLNPIQKSDGTDYGPGSVSFYMVAIDGDKIFISDSKSVTLTTIGSTGAGFSLKAQSTAAASLSTTFSAGGWYTKSVPEPTSGLLMLVGLGALALRRRKA